MLFNTLSVLGFLALASAAPTLHSRFENDISEREALPPAERGLTWTPTRSLSPRGNTWNNFAGALVNTQLLAVEQITILTLQQQQLTQIILAQEIELQRAIAAQIKANLQLQFALDNIRINTFNNMNKNLNTIIVVVTEVIDNRVTGNANSRYIYRQLQSNSAATQQVFVQIVETAQLTITNPIPSNVIAAAQATSTAFATPNVSTFTPGSALAFEAAGINLLPAGQGVPAFSNVQGMTDPAAIVLPGQAAFVSFNTNANLFTLTAPTTATTVTTTTANAVVNEILSAIPT